MYSKSAQLIRVVMVVTSVLPALSVAGEQEQKEATQCAVQFGAQAHQHIEQWLLEHHVPVAYFTPHNVMLLRSQQLPIPRIVMGLPKEVWASYKRSRRRAQQQYDLRGSMCIGAIAGLQFGSMYDDCAIDCNSGKSIVMDPLAHTYKLLGMCSGALLGAGCGFIRHVWHWVARDREIAVVHAEEGSNVLYVQLHGLQRALHASGITVRVVDSITEGAFQLYTE